jgi:preprotein translocase subunit SecF
MKPIRLIPHGVKMHAIRLHPFSFALTFCLIAASVFFYVTKGLNYGVDFSGGTSVEIELPEGEDIGSLREKAVRVEGIKGEPQLQESDAPGADRLHVIIRLQQQSDEEGEGAGSAGAANDAAVSAILAALGENVVPLRREFVGPTVGEELKKQATIAVTLAMLGIALYIWFRFEWQFGVAALIALIHDVVSTIGLYSVTGLEFSVASVAAVLMIAGYSINDTVVVFDRVREDLRKYKKRPLPEIFDEAINETLSRTVMTSLTVLLALVALYFFGGENLRGFSIAFIWGTVIGTYSSIFVAVPVLLYMNLRRETAEAPSAEPAVG